MSKAVSLNVCGEVTGQVGSIISLLVRYPVVFIKGGEWDTEHLEEGTTGKVSH